MVVCPLLVTDTVVIGIPAVLSDEFLLNLNQEHDPQSIPEAATATARLATDL